MRILHVVGGLANSSGTTHIILNLARGQADLGHDASIWYVANRTPDTVASSDPRVDVRGFPLTALRRYAWSASLARALERRVGAFDVLHVHSLWLHLNLAVWRACTRRGVPYMIAPQGTLDTWTLRHRGWHKRVYGALVEKRILDAAGGIQAVSPKEVANAKAYGVRAPVFLVPNGVDPEAYAALPPRDEARRRLGLGPDDEVVLFLSRLHPKKGTTLLVEAFGAVAADRPRARLVVAGSDRGRGYAAEVRAAADRLGLGARVLMPGEIRGEDKMAALAAADLYALPSHSEGLPVAVLESLAAGLPCVISPGCYVPEVQAWGAGRVVERDAARMADALRELLDDADARRRMSARARELARTVFAWPRVTARLMEAYETTRHRRPR